MSGRRLAGPTTVLRPPLDAVAFGAEVLGEVMATYTRRRTRLVGLLVNLLLAVGWIGWSQWHPSRPEAFAAAHVGVLVVVWMMADVVNTNQLGADGEEVHALLDAGRGVARILAVRNLALATVIVPLALTVTLVAQALATRAPDLGRASLADVGAVFCWLGVGSVLSVLLPYRPLPWRARLALPRTWIRWATCVGAPWIAVLGLEPALRLADRTAAALGKGAPLAVGVLCWVLGLAGAALLARRHARALRHRLRMTE
ncbi:hypothetical protein [Actinomycetospora chiangmaiensis]|uniref:hypothetical protein n=1 Tax=Actinomycetospora chiangmaiensis TaxID=402650 RepID=UPI0003644D35|nr:hypothetical protein [Actinomycetospora chiangmaiensis]